MLEITPEVRDAIVAHALRCRPNEACGMITAPSFDLTVDEFWPIRNDAQSATRFCLDPGEMLELERTSDERGRSIVGVVHSHLETTAWPSPIDIADSSAYDPVASFRQILVSLRDAEPSMRCFRIVAGVVHEERLVVAGDGPTVQDQAGTAAAVLKLPR